jgi:soluble P-type ATPase
MSKPGILIEIPGFGTREIRTVVSDYTGTLSCGGRLAVGLREKLLTLQQSVDIRVISADSFGTANEELAGIVKPDILRTNKHDAEKQDYVNTFDLKHVAAFGNGNNDRLLLKTVKEGGGLAISVDNGEGCARRVSTTLRQVRTEFSECFHLSFRFRPWTRTPNPRQCGSLSETLDQNILARLP